MDYGLQLGRRFRALKFWFVLRYFGRERIAAILRSHILWAQEFAGWVEADPRFELAAPAPLSLVCFRYRGADEENQRLLDQVNATGKAFLSHTVLNGRFVLRMAIGNIATTREDIESLWTIIREKAAGLR
jgi:aromatic-L-amino-acid decarboxylase